MANEKTTLKRRVTTGLKEPDMYVVILHNDDFTTMDFVVSVLQLVFHKTPEQAQQLMMEVHRQGSAQVAMYTYDVAVTKVQKTTELARKQGFPLLVTCTRYPDLPF